MGYVEEEAQRRVKKIEGYKFKFKLSAPAGI